MNPKIHTKIIQAIFVPWNKWICVSYFRPGKGFSLGASCVPQGQQSCSRFNWYFIGNINREHHFKKLFQNWTATGLESSAAGKMLASALADAGPSPSIPRISPGVFLSAELGMNPEDCFPMAPAHPSHTHKQQNWTGMSLMQLCNWCEN